MKIVESYNYVSFDDFKNKTILQDRRWKSKYQKTLVEYLKDNNNYSKDIVRKCYDFLFVNGTMEYFFNKWFDDNVKMKMTEREYLFFSLNSQIREKDIISGMYKSTYSRLCKNLNFYDFYNTTKYSKDSWSMYNFFERMNKLILFPDMFIPSNLKLIEEKNYENVMATLRGLLFVPTIFNPHTYAYILNFLFDNKGKKLFTPVLAWNSYQHAFYNTNYDHYVGTDVIPKLVDNSKYLHSLYEKEVSKSFFMEEKNVDVYCCPSEKLDERYDFSNKYKEYFDSILFSPPYFELEIYPGKEQSIKNYENYDEWLKKYWEETLKICYNVLKKNGLFGFVVSDYKNLKTKRNPNLSNDMYEISKKYFSDYKTYKIKWSNFETKSLKKNEDGNFENLFILKK